VTVTHPLLHVETLSVRAEAADIRITQLTLLWVPTA